MLYVSYMFGIIAIVFLIISFQINDKNILFKYQIISSFASFFQYLFIGGLMGALMNLVAGIRNFVFKRYDGKIPVFVLIFFIVLITFLSMLSFDGNISLIPMLVDIFACILFLIYDACIFSVTGFIKHFIELVFCLISIYRFDVKKEEA